MRSLPQFQWPTYKLPLKINCKSSLSQIPDALVYVTTTGSCHPEKVIVIVWQWTILKLFSPVRCWLLQSALQSTSISFKVTNQIWAGSKHPHLPAMCWEHSVHKMKQTNFYLISLFFPMVSGIFWIALILSLVDILARSPTNFSSVQNPWEIQIWRWQHSNCYTKSEVDVTTCPIFTAAKVWQLLRLSNTLQSILSYLSALIQM